MKDFPQLKIRFAILFLILSMMIITPAMISIASNLPESVAKRYADHENLYWRINQINISPIFDEPETTIVEFYFSRPENLFVKTDQQEILSKGDTIWTYLLKQYRKSNFKLRKIFHL